ncbi:MAG: hypothetical protein SF051_13430 [Elusimicrobiota bacterium]|nr:hypothetical protein [Elusimicrobiota bacterium]
MHSEARLPRGPLLPLLVVAGSCLLTVLALELGGRLVAGGRLLDSDLYLRTTRLAYEPHQRQRWRRLEWDVDYEINSRGFRDREPPVPGRPAVLFLGDSFTEGYGVELEKTFVRRVEAALAAAGRPEAVVNAGLQGRSLSNYLRIYEDLFAGNPDIGLVVMVFETSTDVEAAATDGYVALPGRAGALYRVKRFLSEHSILYNLVRRPSRGSRGVSRVLMKAGVMGPLEGWTMAVDPKQKPAWEDTARRIKAFRDRLKAEGKDFYLVLIPHREQADAAYLEHMLAVTGLPRAMFQGEHFYDYMTTYAKANGIPFTGLLEPLRAAETAEPGCCFFLTDNHWNARGHGVVARAIADGLRRAGLPRARRRER